MIERYEDWINRIADGEKPTLASFARSALGEIPKIEKAVVKLDPGRWPGCCPICWEPIARCRCD